MKNIHIIGVVIGLAVFMGSTTASRNLPGMDLITRDEWGADESANYRNSEKLRSAYEHPDYELGWIAGRGSLELLDEDLEVVDDIKNRGELVSQFLKANPGYYPTIVTNFVSNDNLLSRPHKYTATKNSVTIHHTADGRTYRQPSESLPGLLEIYRQHAVAKQRGDIGYNFIIDPQGRIYEGRGGGEGVIGGHANLRNSMTSLGVALLGNFENIKPTSKALHSLKHLTTVLTYQYSIDPDSSSVLFDRQSEEPFIKAHVHDHSVLGHKDIKPTACPGEYLYAQIPGITNEVADRLDWMSSVYGSRQLTDDDLVTLPRSVWSEDRSLGFVVPWNETIQTVDVQTFGDGLGTVQGSIAPGGVRIAIDYVPGSSGWHTVGVQTDRGSKLVSFAIVREQDLQDDVAQLKTGFDPATPAPNTKIADKITSSQAKQYLQEDINVLLYEPTRLGQSNLSCVGGCRVKLDDLVIENAEIVIIREEADGIVAFVDLVRYEIQAAEVSAMDGGVVQITNFDRYSGATALNTYKGSLLFQTQSRRDLESGFETSFTVVNRLPMRDYIQGMGESSELQQYEKTKALAYLTKMYVLFYRSGNNPHPSIPQGVNYTAIDDPRSFQRYLGAGIEATSDRRLQMVDETYETVITYDGYVPLMPYYHCSGGFSRSGAEKFGWTDTPWLVSRKDFVACESGQFEGHGVGMSGDGAEYLAQAGASAEEILQWWYEGIVFED